MREIKFRTWCELGQGQWFMRNVIQVDWHNRIIQVDKDFFGKNRIIDIPFNSVKLMQYTGFKDCKGIEMYEGDLVQFNLQNGAKVVLQVKWNDEKGYWGNVPVRPRDLEILDKIESYEVIGNIYEKESEVRK